tara:strand:+ start:33245 stop:34840 length:1596 start_codon:yes stop_codon:yes gene_type:complete
MIKLFLRNIHYILFLIVSIIAINFNYVEGDDASMMMYHALGRSSELQPAYSPYHSMFDKVLSFFTSNELFLRYLSISLSFVANFVVYILLLKILKLKGVYNSVLICLLPFIIPEMFFSGLYINPTIISFSIILGCHILLIKYFNENNKIFLLLSVLLFGFATSIRWSNGLYLFVLFGEFFIYLINKNTLINFKRKLVLLLFVCTTYVVSVLFFIYISGYSIFDIINTYSNGKSYIENKEFSYLSYVANATTYLTLSFIPLLFIGGYFVIKKRSWNIVLLFVFSFLPFFGLGFYPSYKYMITTLPVLAFVISFGYQELTNKYHKWIVYVLIAVPCLLGVKVYSNSSFGPGFAIKTDIQETVINKESFNPDSRTKIEKIGVGFYGGLAMPTPEGPRPIGGYLWVLLSDWSLMIENINNQRSNAVNYAIKHNLTIIQDVNHSFISSKLLELGYMTSEPFNNNKGDYSLRKFIKGKHYVSIMVPNNKSKLFDAIFMDQINSSNELVLYSSYTNIVNKLNKSSTFVTKNSYWGIIK